MLNNLLGFSLFIHLRDFKGWCFYFESVNSGREIKTARGEAVRIRVSLLQMKENALPLLILHLAEKGTRSVSVASYILCYI